MSGARFENNGIPPPDLDLPVRSQDTLARSPDFRVLTIRCTQFPEKPEVVTSNLLKITELVPDA